MVAKFNRNVLRFLPALNITDKDLDKGIEIIRKSVEEFDKQN